MDVGIEGTLKDAASVLYCLECLAPTGLLKVATSQISNSEAEESS